MQKIVDKASLELLNVTIREAHETTVSMEANFAIVKPWYAAAFSCSFASMAHINVTWLQGNFQRHLGHLSMQAQELNGQRTLINVKETFAIDDVQAFTDFTVSLLKEKDVLTWELHSILPWIQVKVLPGQYGPIDFRKQVQLKGFDGLSTIQVDDLDLPGDAPQGRGILAEINATIHNPSILQIELGSVNLRLSYKDKHLGDLHTDNLFLGLGATHLPLTGVLRPEDVLSAGEFFSAYMGGHMAVASTGPGSCSHRECPSWVRTLLRTLKSNASVPGYKGPPLLQQMDARQLGLSLYSDIDDSMNVTLAVKIATPFGFTFAIDSISADVNLSSGGQASLNLNVPLSTALWDPGPATGQGVVILHATGVNATVLNHTAFAQSLKQIITGPFASFAAFGVGAVTIGHCLLGNLTISGIPIPGLALDINPGLDSIPGMVVESLDVLGGNANGLDVSLQTRVPNPMALHFQTPLFPLKLLLHVGSGELGNITMRNMNLIHGNNTLPTGLVLNSDSAVQGRVSTLFQQYLNGSDQTLGLHGDSRRPDLCVTTLAPALSALHSSVLVPGFRLKLMTYAKIDFKLGYLLEGHLPVRIMIKNPWTSAFTLTKIESDVFIYDGRDYNIKFGHVSYAKPVFVTGGSSSYTPDLGVAIEIKNCLAPIRHLRFCLDSLKALFGDILMRANAALSVTIGDGFEVNFAYSEEGLPASFKPEVDTEASMHLASRSLPVVSLKNSAEIREV